LLDGNLDGLQVVGVDGAGVGGGGVILALNASIYRANKSINRISNHVNQIKKAAAVLL
jgi:hypothetical protein